MKTRHQNHNKQAVDYLLSCEDKIQEMVNSAQNSLGFTKLFYYRLFDDGRYLQLSNIAEMTGRFMKQLDNDADGGAFNKNLGRCFDKSYNFLWESASDDALIRKNANYNVANGVSIYRRLKDSFEVHSFATSRDNQGLTTSFLNNEQKYQDFITHFNDKAADMIDTSDDARLARYSDYKSPEPEKKTSSLSELETLTQKYHG